MSWKGFFLDIISCSVTPKLQESSSNVMAQVHCCKCVGKTMSIIVILQWAKGALWNIAEPPPPPPSEARPKLPWAFEGGWVYSPMHKF